MANIGHQQHYCLRWNNYQSNMTSVFYQLLSAESFVDVTLTCNDRSLKAHKVVLSACSSYFQKLLMDNPCKHPTIILPQEVGFSDLKFIIDFVYRGEIDVSQAQLQSLLKTADQLKIKGLCEVPDGEDEVETLNEQHNDSMNEVNLLGNHLLHDKSQKHKLFSKIRSGKFHSQIKRKFPQDVNCAGTKKYCAKELKTLAEHRNVQLVQTTTINPNDILDASNTPQYHTLQPASCITVATSTDDDEKDLKTTTASLPVVILDNRHAQPLAVTSSLHYLSTSNQTQACQQTEKIIMTCNSPIMGSSCTTLATLQAQPPILIDQSSHQQHLTQSSTNSEDDKVREVEIMSETQPAGPTATPVQVHSIDIPQNSPTHRDIAVDTSGMQSEEAKVKFETLRTMDQTSDSLDMDNHMSEHSMNNDDHTMHTMMITPELLGLIPSGSSAAPSEAGSDIGKNSSLSKKDWTQEDMEAALDALRNHNMSLTKASITYGIPSTTLWQRAHRLGIDTPKKEGPTRSWNEDILNVALDALRNGSLSANKASKAYGIPSSTLYKIARREGIRLAAPFNAAPTTWTQDDLEKALEAIRTGQTTVQKAATEYGIPTGTLYGRCKREKIELSRSNPAPWSQDAMTEALDAIRLGHMSINQASIQYNLPYSSLYGRVRRGGKYDNDPADLDEDSSSNTDVQNATTATIVQHQEVQQDAQGASHSQQSSIQPQIMLLQYQPTSTTHIQMYQPTAPS